MWPLCRVARLGLLVLLGRDVLNSLVTLPNYYEERLVLHYNTID